MQEKVRIFLQEIAALDGFLYSNVSLTSTKTTCKEGSKSIFLVMKNHIFLSIFPPPGLLPVLGPCERYMTPTLDAALLISSRCWY